MNNPNAFTEALHALIDLAAAKGNHLTRGEIHFYLKEHLPEEKQFDPVYAFLAEHGIGIEGYEPLNSRETASSQHKAAGESSAGTIRTSPPLRASTEETVSALTP